MRPWNLLNIPWAIVVAGALVAVAVYFSGPQRLMAIFGALTTASTALLALLTYLYWRSQRRVEWFTGAMERHSDQQRQIAANEAGLKLIWWDRTHPEANGDFPFEGAHGQEFTPGPIYVGILPQCRFRRPSILQRWIMRSVA
jgi:hypothetical protein